MINNNHLNEYRQEKGQEKLVEENRSKSIEDSRRQSSKLDSSLFLYINMNINNKSKIEDQKQYGMIMRRRGILCQYSAKDETITLPLNSTFSPKEEVREVNNDDRSTIKKSDVATRKGGDSPSEQLKAKIFSIAASSFLLITTITLATIICLFVCNRASVLVNAQHSSFGQTQNGNNNNNHKSNNNSSNNNNVKLKVTRQINNGQHLAGYSAVQPNIITARNSRSNAIVQDQSETQLLPPATAANKQQLHHNSIDRFDSGEQIKAPYLRQPTTLKPLTTNPQQVSSNKAYNLQTAASQESYLSPEDREQLLKNHENHYEGKNYDQQSSQDSISAPDRDQYEKPPSKQRWSQPDGPYDLGSARSNNLEHQASKLRGQSAGQSPNANADNEDSDYEDEPHEGLSDKRANNVPEIRRPTGSASYHHSHTRYRERVPSSAAAAPSEGDGKDESEPSDDYGGANDEVHFSRVSNQQNDRNTLNPSASYNQQSRKAHQKRTQIWSPANQEYENPRHGGSSSHGLSKNNNNNNEGPSDEHHGFGPGPNEAYMFDRAESGRPSGEHEEEGMNLGPGGDPPESSNANEEGNKFDRRLLNQYPEGLTSNSIAQGSPAKYGKSSLQQGSNSNENSDLDDADDSGESSEDSATSPSSSSKAESKSRLNPVIYAPRLTNVIPKTSASAPAPLSTLSSSSSPPTYSLPISVTPPAYKSSIISSHQPFQNRQQGGGQSHVNNLMTLSSNNQNKASKLPYNPQDNPSHAGKYFIN